MTQQHMPTVSAFMLLLSYEREIISAVVDVLFDVLVGHRKISIIYHYGARKYRLCADTLLT